MTIEHERLANDGPAWKRWGPYLSERGWGTVREDYSASGSAWEYFPHDHARSRAYRWGEDGIAGLTDRYGFLNLAIALWNRRDDRLKERPFGLTNPQGNHGEDVKEYWWHLDATPTHAYGEFLYRYPQRAFPYAHLVAENARRCVGEDELELRRQRHPEGRHQCGGGARRCLHAASRRGHQGGILVALGRDRPGTFGQRSAAADARWGHRDGGPVR